MASLAFANASAAAQPSSNARVLYSEPFETVIDARTGLSQKSTSGPGLEFEAYGRRFELALEPNAPLEGKRRDRRGAELNTAAGVYRSHLQRDDLLRGAGPAG